MKQKYRNHKILFLTITLSVSALVLSSEGSAEPSMTKIPKSHLEPISPAQVAKEIEDVKANIVAPSGPFLLGWKDQPTPRTEEEKQFYRNDTELSKLYFAVSYVAEKLNDRLLELIQISNGLGDEKSMKLAHQLLKIELQSYTEMRRLLLLASPLNLMRIDFADHVANAASGIEIFQSQVDAFERKRQPSE